MSIHTSFNTSDPVPQLDTAPIVLRFQGLWPQDLGRFEMHDRRTGGDLLHVDQASSQDNQILWGEEDWIKTLRREIKDMSLLNHEHHIAALIAKSRISEAGRVEEAGPLHPWRQSIEGPLREGILTVNKAWFGGTGAAGWKADRIEQFRNAALGFLQIHFPAQQLRYAASHTDEEAFHLHFVAAVWTEKTTGNRGRQFLLRPGANPLLANYEHAQDVAGDHFAAIGLQRGERRAAAVRAAKEAGDPLPEIRAHVPPSKWRARERARARTEAKALFDAGRDRAEQTVEDGRELGNKTVRKSRKRAIAEAKARKAAAAREVEKSLALAANARAQAETATLERDDAVRERGAAKEAVAQLEKASTQIVTQCQAMEQRAIRVTEIRIAEERKVREASEMQAELLVTSHRIEAKLIENQRTLERREGAVALREKGAEAFERGIAYIADGGIAWDENEQKFAVDSELLSVDRNSLRATVRAAGPLFLRVAKAISRAAHLVLQRAQAQIMADVRILSEIREEMGLPREGRLAEIVQRHRDDSRGPGG
ncbi:hypothetical protein [Puniceibacterium sediminis]|uniref:Plasmid recombination enzyme n=1 Tax=Puniceibacterium sediminis TaxID=1608407 RepID=A0A238WED2_9RHOB|nr:hypothetical protein [Puniceibacterium sediminis]SNR44787.1 hypothetical protein SAMN06265370_105146 [Puniceibacterium sediminis]